MLLSPKLRRMALHVPHACIMVLRLHFATLVIHFHIRPPPTGSYILVCSLWLSFMLSVSPSGQGISTVEGVDGSTVAGLYQSSQEKTLVVQAEVWIPLQDPVTLPKKVGAGGWENCWQPGAHPFCIGCTEGVDGFSPWSGDQKMHSGPSTKGLPQQLQIHLLPLLFFPLLPSSPSYLPPFFFFFLLKFLLFLHLFRLLFLLHTIDLWFFFNWLISDFSLRGGAEMQEPSHLGNETKKPSRWRYLHSRFTGQ